VVGVAGNPAMNASFGKAGFDAAMFDPGGF
jgi:hypothetical protein